MRLRDNSQNEASNLQQSHVILSCFCILDRPDHWRCSCTGLGLAVDLFRQVCECSASVLRSMLIRIISAPLCVIAIVVIIVAMPKHFGLDQHTPSFRTRASYRSFANLDIMGSLLMMAGSFLIVAVLNETNLAFSWSSRDAIALLVLTGVSWIAFFAWEWYISGIPGKDPIFPKRWLFDRPWLGILM